MKINILYFANLREIIGLDSETIDVKGEEVLSDLIETLKEKHPVIKQLSFNLLFAVNTSYADKSLILKDGDEVAILPPLSGG